MRRNLSAVRDSMKKRGIDVKLHARGDVAHGEHVTFSNADNGIVMFLVGPNDLFDRDGNRFEIDLDYEP
jgi:hypothetical protein